MTGIKALFRGLMQAVFRVLVWVILALGALFVLALALLLLLLGMLWALLGGKRPEPPVFVGKFRRYTSEYVWPGGASRKVPRKELEVIDVQDVEVRDETGTTGRDNAGRGP